MNLFYRSIQVVSLAVSLISEIVLLLMLTWLIGGHGVIACGRGIFDGPNWFFDVAIIVGVPLGIFAGSIILFLRCSNHLDRLEDQRKLGEICPS